MPWTPKSAPPRCLRVPPLPAFECAANGGITLFSAPPGYVPADGLARALHIQGRPTLWLRLGPEDRDPAVLLVSLIAGMQQIRAGAGSATLEQMRRQPGPIAGWPPLFAQLAQELAELLGSSGALVLEHCHYLTDACRALRLLGAHVLSDLPPGISCILTSERPLPPYALPAHAVCLDAGALRLSGKAAQELADQPGCNLPSACVRSAVALTDGRAVALAGLCAAAEVLGPAPIEQAVGRASNLDELLAWIAHAWLVTAQIDSQRALALALRVGYTHPALIERALDSATLPCGPWFERLEHEWSYVQPMWRSALRTALRARAKPESQALRRAADYLAAQGAIEQAVPLYYDAGAWAGAAEAIAGAADTLMSLAEWETLEEWLSQLPARTLGEWPWLVYIGGELAVIQGQVSAAQRAFGLASRIFTCRHDAQGACQSLLAESTLAEWQSDRSRAEMHALAAHVLAEKHALPWYQGWAAWQLGRLSAAADDLEAALFYFSKAETAAQACGEMPILELPRQAERLTACQRELRRERELHRQAYFTAEQSEHEAADRLHELLSTPPIGVDGLFVAYGWLRLPLMLKLPAPNTSPDADIITLPASMFDRLLNKLGLRRYLNASSAAARSTMNCAILPAPPSRRADQAIDRVMRDVHSLGLVAAANSESAGDLAMLVEAPNSAPAMSAARLGNDLAWEVGSLHGQPVPVASGAAPATAAPSLTAYLLGPFRAMLNGHPIESWPSARGRSVFKYLLAQRGRAIPRDVLMDTFWPDANPESARNSLNVALHGLRQALRAAGELQVVIFENGAYRLNPYLSIWIDVEEFERSFQAARSLEAAGQIAAAVAEYEAAISLYQDDFFVDDPYEEWPVLARERLRVMFLEALDRLSQIYFGRGEYAACTGLCQRILSRDNCREDAHCRLMRCHSRQGQQNLALRQYQVCAEALRAELDVEPAPAITELYARIRRHETV